MVLLKNANDMWQTYVNYIDNKACTKELFFLTRIGHFLSTRIDQFVDSAPEQQFPSFKYSFSSYKQFVMAKENEIKTSFIINKDMYYSSIGDFMYSFSSYKACLLD